MQSARARGVKVLKVVHGWGASGEGGKLGPAVKYPRAARKKNALRHSYISHRVAETQDVAQVALEAGNSPQIIFQHYRELVRLKEAKEWFAIGPDAGEKFSAMLPAVVA